MLKKNSAKSCVVIVTIALIIALAACGYRGNEFANQPPEVAITSFTGYDTIDEAGEVLPDSLRAFPFQQQIFWRGYDPDGVVVGYAYRVLGEDGLTPISTPGNEFIDDGNQLDHENQPYTVGQFTPDILKHLGTGWVIHYRKGASESLPINHRDSAKDVWTEKVSATINFPAKIDDAGNPIPVASAFEVVAIDNKGSVSAPAKKYFYSTSIKPTMT